MSKINWEAAPEWATKHGYVASDVIPVWLNSEQYCYVDGRQYGRIFTFAGREGWGIDQMIGVTERPVDALKAESAPAWVGVGLPPAGQCVEVHRGPATWIEKDEWQIGKTAEVMSAFTNSRGHGIAAIQFPSGHCECILSACLKPVRTPEQIAAEEREKSISEMVDICMTDNIRSNCADLYDAGYRKQEAK